MLNNTEVGMQELSPGSLCNAFLLDSLKERYYCLTLHIVCVYIQSWKKTVQDLIQTLRIFMYMYTKSPSVCRVPSQRKSLAAIYRFKHIAHIQTSSIL